MTKNEEKIDMNPRLAPVEREVRLCHYTVQACHKSGAKYGPIHGSSDCNMTLCGKGIDENWWILTTNGCGATITCKKCVGA